MADPTLTEQWVPIEGWPLYEISNLGNVRRIIKPSPDRAGYLRVNLCDGPKRHRTIFVHTLVCRAFHGPKPLDKTLVAHADGNAKNNAANNLRWATALENSADMIGHGKSLRGHRSPRSKITEDEARKIKKLLAEGKGPAEIARLIPKVTRGAIGGIKYGNSWWWV